MKNRSVNWKALGVLALILIAIFIVGHVIPVQPPIWEGSPAPEYVKWIWGFFAVFLTLVALFGLGLIVGMCVWIFFPKREEEKDKCE